MLLRRVLRAEPTFEVVEARDGLAAWEMLQDRLLPALITLDIMMPRMDGLDLLARIRANDRLHGVKIVMCTAVNDRPRMSSANSLDIDGYILKPFTSKNILDQVRQIFHKDTAPTLPAPGSSESSTKQPIDWQTCGSVFDALALAISNNLGVLRSALSVDDRESAMREVETMRNAGQQFGMLTLTHAANRLGAAILVGDAPNISKGMQTVEAVSREGMEKLAGLKRPEILNTAGVVPPSAPV